MTVYAFATHTVVFLAGSGLACWLVPWLIDRGAQRRGYDEGWQDREQLVERGRHYDESSVEDWDWQQSPGPINLAERLEPYVTPVDPPTASY